VLHHRAGKKNFNIKKDAKKKKIETWVIGSVDNFNNIIKKIQQQ
jgi:hypothetical protein